MSTRREPTSLEIFAGSLRITQRYDDAGAEICVRRVKTEADGEHVQISIVARRFHEKRTTETHASLNLSPADAAVLVRALTKLLPPHDRTRTHAEDEKHYAEHYGLKLKSGSLSFYQPS